jgi:hypothetical protein
MRKEHGTGSTSGGATNKKHPSDSSMTSWRPFARSRPNRRLVSTSVAAMGENYIPLVEGGLDLIGLDISGEAISQLRKRLPETTEQLVHGDLRTLPSGHTYAVVIGIQVFQHGSRRRLMPTSLSPSGSSRRGPLLPPGQCRWNRRLAGS